MCVRVCVCVCVCVCVFIMFAQNDNATMNYVKFYNANYKLLLHIVVYLPTTHNGSCSLAGCD